MKFIHGDSHGAMKAIRSVVLISLPVTEKEVSWFVKFLEDGGERKGKASGWCE